MSKAVVASAVLCLSLLHQLAVQADQTMELQTDHESLAGDYGSGVKINCGEACAARCRLASRKNMCHRACGTCCARCNCVPPGTSGNRDVCPCYAKMTTHGGRLKCP